MYYAPNRLPWPPEPSPPRGRALDFAGGDAARSPSDVAPIAAIGKFDVQTRPRPDRSRCPQRLPVAIAHQRKAAREHAAIGIGGQQLSGAAQTCDAAVAENPEGAVRAIAERGGLLPAPLDTVRQQPRRQPRGGARQLRVVDLRIGAQRARQPSGAGIEALARHREQIVERRQGADEQAQLLARAVDVAPPAGELAGAEI